MQMLWSILWDRSHVQFSHNANIIGECEWALCKERSIKPACNFLSSSISKEYHKTSSAHFTSNIQTCALITVWYHLNKKQLHENIKMQMGKHQQCDRGWSYWEIVRLEPGLLWCSVLLHFTISERKILRWVEVAYFVSSEPHCGFHLDLNLC